MVTGGTGIVVAGSCSCPHHSGKKCYNASHLLDSDSCSLSFQELVFSASPDATIRIWSVPNTSCVQVVRAHESAVTGLSLHATGDYLLSSSDDQVQSQPGRPEGAAFSSWEEGLSFWGQPGSQSFGNVSSLGTNSASGY